MDVLTEKQNKFNKFFLKTAMKRVMEQLSAQEEHEGISPRTMLDSTSNAVNVVSSGLVLAGTVGAAPTLGTSLAATGACVVILQTGDACRKVVKRYLDKKNDEYSVGETNYEEAVLQRKLLLREIGERLSIEFAQFIEDIAEEKKGIAEFAIYSATKMIEMNCLDPSKSATEVIDDFVFQLNQNSDTTTITANRKYFPGSRFTLNFCYARRAYTRPGVMIPFLAQDRTIRLDCYTSVPNVTTTILRQMTMQDQYGYRLLVREGLFSTEVIVWKKQKLRKELPKPESERLKARDFVSYHQVDRSEIEAYLRQQRYRPQNSFNQYLSDRFGARIIAEYHDVLDGLDFYQGDFSGVNFRSTRFVRCSFGYSKWEKAHLEFSVFEGGLFEHAFFDAVYAEKTHWSNLSLNGSFLSARLNASVFDTCQFSPVWQHLNCELDLAEFIRTREPDGLAQQLTDEYFKRVEAKLAVIQKEVQDITERVERLERIETQPLASIQRALSDAFQKPLYQKTRQNYIERSLISISESKRQLSSEVFQQFLSDKTRHCLLLTGDVFEGKTSVGLTWLEELSSRTKEDWLSFYFDLQYVAFDLSENPLEACFKKNPSDLSEVNRQVSTPIFIVLDGVEHYDHVQKHSLVEGCLSYRTRWPVERQCKFVLIAQKNFLCRYAFQSLLKLSADTLFPLQAAYVLAPLNETQSQGYLETHIARDPHFLKMYKTLRAQDWMIDGLMGLMSTAHIVCDIVRYCIEHKVHFSSKNDFYLKFFEYWNIMAIDRMASGEMRFKLNDIDYYETAFAQALSEENAEMVFSVLDQGSALEQMHNMACRLHMASAAFFIDFPPSMPLTFVTPVHVERDHHSCSYTIQPEILKHFLLSEFLYRRLQKGAETFDRLLKNWNTRFLTGTPDVLSFLRDKILVDPNKEALQILLVRLVKSSQGTPDGVKNERAASNAFSLLCAIGYAFNQLHLIDDFVGIHVRNADASGGLLSGFNLVKGDYSNVCFANADLSDTCFADSNLENIQFWRHLMFIPSEEKPQLYDLLQSKRLLAYTMSGSKGLLASFLGASKLRIIQVMKNYRYIVYGEYDWGQNRIVALKWCQLENHLAIADTIGTIRILSLKANQQSKNEPNRIRTGVPIRQLFWQDHRLISRHEDHTIRGWRVEQQVQEFMVNVAEYALDMSLPILFSERMLIAVTQSKSIMFFQIQGESEVAVLSIHEELPDSHVQQMMILDDKIAMIFEGNLCVVYLYDLKEMKLFYQIPVKSEVKALCAHERELAIVRKDNHVDIWDLSENACRNQYDFGQSIEDGLSFSDQQDIVLRSQDARRYGFFVWDSFSAKAEQGVPKLKVGGCSLSQAHGLSESDIKLLKQNGAETSQESYLTAMGSSGSKDSFYSAKSPNFSAHSP